jgi:hypothetical protein
VTCESSTEIKPNFAKICVTAPAVMKLLETELKSDRTLARYGATVERSAKTVENSDAIWTSMAGIDIPTTMEDMRGTAPVGGIAIAGVGTVTPGIATEKNSTLADGQVRF